MHFALAHLRFTQSLAHLPLQVLQHAANLAIVDVDGADVDRFAIGRERLEPVAARSGNVDQQVRHFAQADGFCGADVEHLVAYLGAEGGEVSRLADDGADQGREEVFGEGPDHGGEGGANDHADCHVDNVSTQDEFFEAAQHVGLLN